MKVKNVKVRLKDVRAGLVIYSVNPYAGFSIQKSIVMSRPFKSKFGESLFFKVKLVNENGTYSTYDPEESVRDCGIYKAYDEKRTFRKLKHAVEYANRLKNDPRCLQAIEDHLEMIQMYDDLSDYYDLHGDE